MSRGAFRLLALPLLVACLLAAAVALIAAGAGLTGPQRVTECAPTVTDGTEAAPGVPLGAAQIADAWIIYSVGSGLGLPPQAEVIAIATAMQESSLLNLPYGTSDSLGLFQQQPVDGWGTPAQVMDPVYSSHAFYDALVQVPGWQALPVTVAAQEVQRSAYPDAYAQWQPIATSLVSSFLGNAPAAVNAVAPASLAVTSQNCVTAQLP